MRTPSAFVRDIFGLLNSDIFLELYGLFVTS